MGLATWLSLILSVMKLLGSLATYANETRLQQESGAAALGRILVDARKTIEMARVARNNAGTRDADAGGLLQPDGFQRD